MSDERVARVSAAIKSAFPSYDELFLHGSTFEILEKGFDKMAVAAIAAIDADREPLEEVLRDYAATVQFEVALWAAQVWRRDTPYPAWKYVGTGTTIADAIRSAVAAAERGE